MHFYKSYSAWNVLETLFVGEIGKKFKFILRIHSFVASLCVGHGSDFLIKF